MSEPSSPLPLRRGIVGSAIACGLFACAIPVADGPARGPLEDRRSAVAPQPAAAAPPAAPLLNRPRARWVAVPWADLPGWPGDRARELWPALQAGCAKPAEGWAGLCARALAQIPASDEQAREWLQAWLQPYRVEAVDSTPGDATLGLATGYFEPLVAASRQPRPGFTVPLYRPPPDLAARKPYWTRQQLDSVPAARASVRGHELAYVGGALDALLLQVQGSGRLRIGEPDGRESLVRVAYAGHNDQPYRSVGRWLIDNGELRAEEASWPAIRDWAARNPGRLREMLWSNPRVVFFRDEPLPDTRIGPRGAMGVALTPERSVAVDPLAIPYGTVLWLDTTEPLAATPLRRLVTAQDTGSAITGAVRIDYFWGWGPQAESRAGRMKQPLRLWALWPRNP